MPLLHSEDFLAEGWTPGPVFRQLIDAVAAYEARGVKDRDYLLKLLKRDFPLPPPKSSMRESPAPLTEAIEAITDVETRNLDAARRSMKELLHSPVIERGALMPDTCPAGQGKAIIPVGGAIAVRNGIIPSAHSADICCSLYTTFYRSTLSLSEEMDALVASTRFGPGGRHPKDRVTHQVLEEDVWDNPFLKGLEEHASMHLADQGDGNHFAYLGEIHPSQADCAALEANGHLQEAAFLRAATETPGPVRVLVTHHGSRGLGAHVFKRGQIAAIKETARMANGIPDAAAWLDMSGEKGPLYWDALQYISRWTLANHQCIHQRFLERLKVPGLFSLGNEHNFVWKRGDLFLHGKGATPAWRDESGRPLLGFIPLNMAAPILWVMGHDNEEFLSFAPHGAGRNLSRTAMARTLHDENGRHDPEKVASVIAETTKGLEVRWWHGKADVTETPLAYKPAAQVRNDIERFGLAKVIAQIEPRGCLMAGDAGPRPWKKEEELTPKQERQIEHRADRRKTRQHLRHPDDEEE
jgi:tRNA-splicing ligase RtcB (3'-phosphate/5'-hydroxy nucleic acid ligase)